MDEDSFFISQRICVFGLGLMGGSLALALRGYCAKLIGVDSNPETLALARQRSIVDLALTDLFEALPQTDLLILAAPVRTNLTLLEELPALYAGELSILDLSSTKSDIVAAMNRLPDRFATLGGHPMCGKETSGLSNADAKLYWDATFALTETVRTTPALRTLAENLIHIIGARSLWLDAETHDRWTAASSHLPYLAAVALALATPEDVAPMIGPGFQSTSRLAASDVTMMMDILLTNRQQVLAAFSCYKAALDEIEMLLQNISDDLPVRLERARRKRESLMKHEL